MILKFEDKKVVYQFEMVRMIYVSILASSIMITVLLQVNNSLRSD